MKRKISYRILLFLCAQLLGGTCFAQSWAPLGTKWYYEGYGVFQGCYNWGYSTMESVRDTVVQGQSARVLQISSFGEDKMPEREEIMYGDADKIYHYLPEADSFYVLYDFSAVAGDTLFIRTTTFQHYYSPNVPADTFSQYIMVVDSTSSMIIDGDTLRVQYVSAVVGDSPSSGRIWGLPSVFIEKIGSRNLMFGLPPVLPTAGCWGGLRCYLDGVLMADFTPNFIPACDYLTFLDSETENLGLVSLSPNPANDLLYLDLPNDPNQYLGVHLAIIDISGKVHLSWDYSAYPDHLFIASLPPGLYLLQIVSADMIRHGRFIKK